MWVIQKVCSLDIRQNKYQQDLCIMMLDIILQQHQTIEFAYGYNKTVLMAGVVAFISYHDFYALFDL